MVHFDQIRGRLEATFYTKGRLDAFEHSLGTFETQHADHGHFLTGQIVIRFEGGDPMAAQSLGDLNIWRALAFRGRVEITWEDIVPLNGLDRTVTLSYYARTAGDRTDLTHIREDVERDLAAIDSFVGSLVAKSLAGSAVGARG